MKDKVVYLSNKWLEGKRLDDNTQPDDLIDNITTDHLTRIPDVLLLDVEELRKSLLLGLDKWNKRELVKDFDRILVAGESFGIGSSRETAAEAIKLNGFRYVFAKSFGPIFLDNLINQGVIPSTNFEILESMIRGKEPELSQIYGEWSPVQRRVLEYGGLTGFIKAIGEGKEELPQKRFEPRKTFPQTSIEKVMTRRSKRNNPIKRGDSLVIKADEFIGYDVFWAHAERILDNYFEGKISIDIKHIWLFLDHFGASSDPNAVEAVKRLQAFWLKHPKAFRGSDGVYNKVMPRKLSVNSLIVGMDSHTPELGIVPGLTPIPTGYTAFACGVANGGLIPYTVPETIKLDFTGQLPGYCEIKDAIWHLVADYFSGSLGNGKMFEIGGEGYTQLTYEEASKIFNAVTEFGGIGAVGYEKNAQVIRYLRKNGSNLERVTETEIDKIYDQMRPDDGAEYKHIVHYDLGNTVPALVGPLTHKKVVFLNALTKKVKIDRVIYNSCAGSSIFDLAVLSQVLSDEKRRIPVDVHLADPLTRIQAEKYGILYELERSGVKIDVQHSCGPCMGQGAFVKKGETVLSTNNRNYPGRMGDENANVYLSSSVIAAMTAKLGRVPSLDEVRGAEASVFRARERVAA